MVLFPNTDITVFNKYLDNATGYDLWKRTVIRNVDWQFNRISKIGPTLKEHGIVSDDEGLIFVDCNKFYLKPKEFLRLDDKLNNEYFTFAPGDKIVKGIIDFEFTINNTIKKLESDYDDVLTITGVSVCSEHIEVSCK